MTELSRIRIFEVTTDNIEVMDRLAADLFDGELMPDLLQAFLAEPTHWLVVAVLDGEVIGKATAMVHRRPDKPDELYLDEIDVVPAHRRKGIAKLILARILEMAEGRGCEECWLGTEKGNIAARKLYEANGAKSEEFLLYYLEY